MTWSAPMVRLQTDREAFSEVLPDDMKRASRRGGLAAGGSVRAAVRTLRLLDGGGGFHAFGRAARTQDRFLEFAAATEVVEQPAP